MPERALSALDTASTGLAGAAGRGSLPEPARDMPRSLPEEASPPEASPGGVPAGEGAAAVGSAAGCTAGSVSSLPSTQSGRLAAASSRELPPLLLGRKGSALAAPNGDAATSASSASGAGSTSGISPALWGGGRRASVRVEASGHVLSSFPPPRHLYGDLWLARLYLRQSSLRAPPFKHPHRHSRVL